MIDSNGKTSSATIKTVMSWLLVFVLTVSSVLPANADIFGVLYALSKRVISASGVEYEVGVTYGYEAGIPAGAELAVREIEKGSAEYKNYLKSAEEKIGGRITDAGFLDIEILSSGEKVEPKAPVKVEIKRVDNKQVLGDELVLSDELTLIENLVGEDLVKEDLVKEDLVADDLVEESMAHILHFEDEGTISLMDVEETDNVVAFEATSFSVYAIIYTVDFSYNGYEISIKGGSSILLSSFARILGVEDFAVSDVESVRFSNESLVTVSRIVAGTAVTGTVVLDGEEIEVSDVAVEGDWVLKSLQAFDTEETLTVVMKDDKVITVVVTDEKMIQDPAFPEDSSKQIVQTISNPAGTVIDLFDYWVDFDLRNESYRSSWPGGYNGNDWDNDWEYQGTGITVEGQGTEAGINKDHPFKFSPAYAGTVKDGTLNAKTNDGKGVNSYTGNADPRQGIVAPKLNAQGYPDLSNNPMIGTNGTPLSYLFDDTNIDGKARYHDVNNLLYVDDKGYYTYDSRVYQAEYKNGNFKLTKQTSTNTEVRGFWPFGTQVFWMGMHLSTPFSMPTDGLVVNPSGKPQPMQFEFSGDDDTWLYLDGILVGDGGGIHNRTEIDINFATGKAIVTGLEDTAHQGTFKETKWLDQLYKDAGIYNNYEWEEIPGDEGVDEDGYRHFRFAAGSDHKFDMFYVERGGGESNLYIHYNLVSTSDFTGHKSYITDDGSVLNRNQFQFELVGFDNNTYTDGFKHALMPNGVGSASGDGTVDNPLKLYDSENGNTSLLIGVSEDGNINFGNIEFSEALVGKKYRYLIREIVPPDAKNDAGVSWAEADEDTRKLGGFKKDNIIYDGTVYYFTGEVQKPSEGEYKFKKTRFKDAECTIPDDETVFNNFENHYYPTYDSVEFLKTNENSRPLQNAVFALYKDKECQIPATKIDGDGSQWTARSDADGKVKFEHIRTGTYYMQEKTAPSGYYLDDTIYEVVIGDETDETKPSSIIVLGDEGNTQVESITNIPEGQLKIVKKWVDSSGRETDGGGNIAKVNLYRKIDESDIPTAHKVTFVFHRDGKGWDLATDTDTTVIVENSSEFELQWQLGNKDNGAYGELYNLVINGENVSQAQNQWNDAGVVKYYWNPWNGSTSLIGIKDIKEDLLIEYTSDSDYFSRKPHVENRTEFSAPNVDRNPYHQTVELDGNSKVFTIGGKLSNHTGYNLPATDDNGIRYLYYIKEVDQNGTEIEIGDAPIEGYQLYSYSQNNETGISNQGILTVTNKSTITPSADITIKKYDSLSSPKKYLSGAEFMLTTNNGTSVPIEGSVEGKFTVPEEGKIITGLTPGEYKIKELKAPYGYVINNTIKEFTVTSDGKVKDNSGNEIEDFLIEIPNEPGAHLPATGGPGTKVYYTLGALLMLFAGVTILMKRRSC